MQLINPKYKYDISVIFPTMNEGDNVKGLVEEIIRELDRLKLNWEIIAIDSPSDNPSYPMMKKFSEDYENITAISLNQKRKAGSGKTFQYMLGFELAQGELIAQIDSDGQDNPADLPKFLEKIDEGYELVVGFKQDRKDGSFYMLSSKVGNAVNRMLTGIELHDMNCGFKVYKAPAAKILNLKSRWYRFIPSILNAKGFKITEVPIENRKREHGKSNFSFQNRLQGGLFDLPIIAILNKYGDVPMYFWGWSSILLGMLFVALLILGSISSGTLQIIFLVFSGGFMVLSVLSFLLGIMIEFRRNDEPFIWSQHEIKEFSKNPNNPN